MYDAADDSAVIHSVFARMSVGKRGSIRCHRSSLNQ
jgi:hypothetical protein